MGFNGRHGRANVVILALIICGVLPVSLSQSQGVTPNTVTVSWDSSGVSSPMTGNVSTNTAGNGTTLSINTNVTQPINTNVTQPVNTDVTQPMNTDVTQQNNTAVTQPQDSQSSSMTTKITEPPKISSTTEKAGSSTQKSTSPSIFEASKSYGRLCEPGNDQVGRLLGCDCRIIKGEAMADCSDRSIQIGTDFTPLPTKLNVSSQVRILDLSSNQLKRIDVDTFNEVMGIRDLKLSKNQISSIQGFHVFPLLTNLDLSFNQLTNLSSTVFSQLPRLKYLDLSHNTLTFIDPSTFTPLTYLQRLSFAFNPLDNEKNYMEVYPFLLRNLTYLEELDLSNCSIMSLPKMALEGSVNLKKLILQNNLFYYLPEAVFSQSHQLEYLDVSGNYFTHLRPFDFAGLENLRTLIVDRTHGLQSIEAHAFAGLGKLQRLTCESNYHLTEIDSQAFRGDSEQNISDCNPKVVQLAHNNLQNFDYPLLKWETLEELELYGNPWVCDCNLKWVSDFIHGSPVKASILIDTDFKCTAPEHLKGTALVNTEPEALQCDSEVALLAGVIAITIFTVLMVAFVVTLTLYHFQMLPQSIENLLENLRQRTSALPKYQKVQVPKPSGRFSARLATGRHDPPDPDLDWDNADVGQSPY